MTPRWTDNGEPVAHAPVCADCGINGLVVPYDHYFWRCVVCRKMIRHLTPVSEGA